MATRPWLSSKQPRRLALSSSFGPRNACAATSTSVPRGLAVTLRLASRQAIANRTERRERTEWACARIPALALCQERHAIKILGDDGKARGGVRKKEREHGSVVLTGDQPALFWVDLAVLIGYLYDSMVTLGQIHSGAISKASFAHLEPETTLIAPAYSSHYNTGLRQNRAQHPVCLVSVVRINVGGHDVHELGGVSHEPNNHDVVFLVLAVGFALL